MYRVDADRDRELDMALQQQSSDNVCDRVNETCFEDVGVPLEASPHKNLTELASEQQFEQFISNLLKYGVFLSSAIVSIGGILYLIRHGTEPADYRFFLGEPSIFRSPHGVVTAVLSGNHRGIIQLGLLILIATPVARVTCSLVAFLWRRDYIYAIFTLLVMVALIYSFVEA